MLLDPDPIAEAMVRGAHQQRGGPLWVPAPEYPANARRSVHRSVRRFVDDPDPVSGMALPD
jgi:hypothetical protein